MLDNIPTKEEFELAAAYYKREEGFPTDEEVLASEKVFKLFLDLGCIFKQDMLSAWAVSYFQPANGILWARKLFK